MEMKSDGCDHFPLNLRVDDSRLINYVRQSSFFLLEIVSLLIVIEYSIYIFMKNIVYNLIMSILSSLLKDKVFWNRENNLGYQRFITSLLILVIFISQSYRI